MKVIEDIEVLKKLAPYLEDINTEYVMREYDNKIMRNNEICKGENVDWYLETLTLDKAVELLPDGYMLLKDNTRYVAANLDEYISPEFTCNSYTAPLQAIEEILLYLIDNNLLPNPNTNAE